jgi:hypothetical protein
MLDCGEIQVRSRLALAIELLLDDYRAAPQGALG